MGMVSPPSVATVRFSPIQRHFLVNKNRLHGSVRVHGDIALWFSSYSVHVQTQFD